MGLILPINGQLFDPRGQVVALHPYEIRTLIRFHDLAQKHDWVLVCRRCGHPIQGYNSSHSQRTMAVACQCTEWRCDFGSGPEPTPDTPDSPGA